MLVSMATNETRLIHCNCFATRQAARQITRFYERHLAPVSLTSAQFGILALLDEEPARPMNQMANILGMQRTTLLRALQPLQREALIESEPAQADPRQLLFSLSAAGRRKYKTAKQLWLQAQQEFEDKVGKQRAARMRQDLLALSLE
jgi:DNA-binding MarR family transcriptional regulator